MDSFACSFELILTDKFYIGENNASKMQIYSIQHNNRKMSNHRREKSKQTNTLGNLFGQTFA